MCWTSESDVSTSTVGENKLMIDRLEDKGLKSSRSSEYSSFSQVRSLFAWVLLIVFRTSILERMKFINNLIFSETCNFRGILINFPQYRDSQCIWAKASYTSEKYIRKRLLQRSLLSENLKLWEHEKRGEMWHNKKTETLKVFYFETFLKALTSQGKVTKKALFKTRQ